MAGMSTSLETYRPAPRELTQPARAWYGAESARLFLTDVLPILARHWTRQRIRDVLRRLTLLTATFMDWEDIERWLQSRGF
jgi:hypothetical protein